MVSCVCPKCHNGVLKFSLKEGFRISFDMDKSNQTVFCRNCKRRISYSVQPRKEKTEK